MSWFLRCPAWRRQINNICSTVPTWASCSVLLVCLRSANCDPSIWDRTVVWKLFRHFQRSTWSGKNNTKKKQKTDPCSSSQSMLHWLAPAAYRSMSLIKASFFFSVLTFIQWSRFLRRTPWRVVKSGKTRTCLWSQQSWRGAPQRTPLLIRFERDCCFLFYVRFQHHLASCWQSAAACGSISPLRVATAHAYNGRHLAPPQTSCIVGAFTPFEPFSQPPDTSFPLPSSSQVCGCRCVWILCIILTAFQLFRATMRSSNAPRIDIWHSQTRLPRLIICLLCPAALTHPMIDAHLNGSFPDQMGVLRLMVEVLRGSRTSLRIL